MMPKYISRLPNLRKGGWTYKYAASTRTYGSTRVESASIESFGEIKAHPSGLTRVGGPGRLLTGRKAVPVGRTVQVSQASRPGQNLSFTASFYRHAYPKSETNRFIISGRDYSSRITASSRNRLRRLVGM